MQILLVLTLLAATAWGQTGNQQRRLLIGPGDDSGDNGGNTGGNSSGNSGGTDAPNAPSGASSGYDVVVFENNINGLPGNSQTPNGVVTMVFQDEAVMISYDLYDVEAKCMNPDSDVNPVSCGIHIHENKLPSKTTCDDLTQVGSLYVGDGDQVSVWYPSVYVAGTDGNSNTQATGYSQVMYGVDFQDTIGQLLILHDWEGEIFTCNVIMDNDNGGGMPTTSTTMAPGGNMQAQGMAMFSDNLLPAPGNTGKYPNGYVSMSFTGGNTVTIQYNLYDVETSCASPDSANTPTSCGLHIHEGMGCANADQIGGLYFNSGAGYTDDVWLASTYTYDSHTRYATGMNTVTFGYDYGDTVMRDFILHAYNGDVIMCAQIMPQGMMQTSDQPTMGMAVFANNLQMAPGYDGNQMPNGMVSMSFYGDSVTIQYDLMGLNPKCANPDPSNQVSCGLHIHQGMPGNPGTGCESADTIGNMYWNDTMLNNPWVLSHYYSDSAGMGSGVNSVTYGYDWDDSVYRDFILHDWDGTVIICNPILPSANGNSGGADIQGVAMFTNNLTPAPGYTGMIQVNGYVSMAFDSALGVTIQYDVSGVEPECMNPNTTLSGVSCGLHIHDGYGCATADGVGGLYWNEQIYGQEDAWMNSHYYADAHGNAKGQNYVAYGWDYDATVYRNLIIHAYDGTVIMCAQILPPDMTEASDQPVEGMSVFDQNLMSAPDYDGSGGMPQGYVSMSFHGQSVTIQYDLDNVEPACENPDPSDPVSCGLHIHEGKPNDPSTTCDNIGNMYWNDTALNNPWVLSHYYADKDGTAMGLNEIDYGYTWEETEGRAFILHAYNGDVIVCNPIMAYGEEDDGVETNSDVDGMAMFEDNLMTMSAATTSINGYVSMSFFGDSVTIQYDLTDVEPSCANPDPTVDGGVSCGLHIHEGMPNNPNQGCIANNIGNMYWNDTMMDNPWTGSHYYADTDGSAAGINTITYGYSYSETVNRDFILHGYNGDVIVCNPIMPLDGSSGGLTTQGPVQGMAMFVMNLEVAPGYTGNVEINGYVSLVFSGTSVTFFYELFGVEPTCVTPDPSNSLSCGMHIHEGTSCANANDVGGLYVNGNKGVKDSVWFPNKYITDGKGETTAQGTGTVDYGYGYDNSVGHDFILHAYNGKVAVCNVITSLEDSADNSYDPDVIDTVSGIALFPNNLQKAPGYDGPLQPQGEVTLVFYNESVLMYYDLEYIEPECANPNKTLSAVSCGLHIHEGTSCNTAGDIGELYYDEATIDDNPWLPSNYYASDGMTTMGSGMSQVTYGINYEDTIGRDLILHAYDGTVIICNVILSAADVVSSTGSPATDDDTGGSSNSGTVTGLLVMFALLFAGAVAYIIYTHYYAGPKNKAPEDYGMM